MATHRPHATDADHSAAVDAFMATLEHPRRREIAELRSAILAADPSIAEGIKWNAPSFRTADYFLTVHLRARRGVDLIFHRGAKVRAPAEAGAPVADPTGLLEWLAPDRAMAVFHDPVDVNAKKAALQALVRAWIAQP